MIGEDFQERIITNNLANGLYYYKIVDGEREQAGSILIAKF